MTILHAIVLRILSSVAAVDSLCMCISNLDVTVTAEDAYYVNSKIN